MALFNQVAFGCERGLVKSDVNEGWVKICVGGRGRVSKRSCGGLGSGKSIGNVGTGSGALMLGADEEWVCTEVGEVGVEVSGAVRVDKVAVCVVKRGCDQWKALWVGLE
eukprot:gene4194-20381_t